MYRIPGFPYTNPEVINMGNEKRPEKPETIKNDPYGCDTPSDVEIRSCSSTDYTGLIPSLPQTDAELESYEELYHYPGNISQD